MSARIASFVGLIVVGHAVIAAAQQGQIPATGDRYQPVPQQVSQPTASDNVFTVEHARKSHPREIQAQLKVLAEQFSAAGLSDEVRIIQELERRAGGQYHQQLLDAYKQLLSRAVEPQISLRVQLIEISRTPETAAALSKFFGPVKDDGISRPADNPDTIGPLSGVYENAKASAWIEALRQQGLLQILSSPQVTILDGRTVRLIQHGDSADPASERNSSRQRSNANRDAATAQEGAEEPRLGGTSLVATAKVQPGKLIKISLIADHEDLQRNTKRMQSDVELREGQTLVVARLQSQELQDEMSRIPVLGNIPVVGRLFKTRKSTPVTRELIFVVTPEIVDLSNIDDIPPVTGFDVSPVRPASYLSPEK